MDLWRRSVQGRLSQVLGPNFIERDAMTRRIQYRGGLDAEWGSYGSDARAIASAFVRGVNAWVALARERPPEEFVLAGWQPEFWSPIDLLNRTDAFVSSGDAIDEVRRGKLSDVIAEAIGRVGAAPFFAGLAADVPGSQSPRDSGVAQPPSRGPAIATDRVNAGVHSGSRASAIRGGVLSLSEARRTFTTPSSRYFVHLQAPGWNVIGATAPWLPGVALGHNERIAWGTAPLDVDTQDVFVDERTSSATWPIVTDAIVVKGRRTPFTFATEITPHGLVIAVDRERGRVFTLRWSGWEVGAAAELGALALDRARSWPEFRAALARWKMPARRVVYADVDGNVGYQDAALVPQKRDSEWTGWVTADALPHALNRRGGLAASEGPVRDAPPAGAPAVFPHALGITGAARRRFSVAPLERRREDDSAVQAVFDPQDWDRSRAINAPGQSESPASPHFNDLAKPWAAGEFVPLAFSDAAVAASAEATLVLAPKSVRPPKP